MQNLIIVLFTGIIVGVFAGIRYANKKVECKVIYIEDRIKDREKLYNKKAR